MRLQESCLPRKYLTNIEMNQYLSHSQSQKSFGNSSTHPIRAWMLLATLIVFQTVIAIRLVPIHVVNAELTEVNQKHCGQDFWNEHESGSARGFSDADRKMPPALDIS